MKNFSKKNPNNFQITFIIAAWNSFWQVFLFFFFGPQHLGHWSNPVPVNLWGSQLYTIYDDCGYDPDLLLLLLIPYTNHWLYGPHVIPVLWAIVFSALPINSRSFFLLGVLPIGFRHLLSVTWNKDLFLYHFSAPLNRPPTSVTESRYVLRQK